MSHPSVSKRQKEIARLERRKAKEVDREKRREDRTNKPTRTDGVDPDIAHIIPGPQPVLE